MPQYLVVSGDFEKTITRTCHQDAAHDAIGMLRSGNFDTIKLGLMTVVTLVAGEPDPMFISTMALVKKHGLNYSENKERDGHVDSNWSCREDD